MKTIAYIPARLHSTRFPKKILENLQGKPLLAWAYENAVKAEVFDEVIILADDSVTMDLAKNLKAKAVFTSDRPKNGTQRIIEALEAGAPVAERIVNVQADEPLLNKKIFTTLLSGSGSGTRMWTLKKKITTSEELSSPNVVKVVTNVYGEALYFSRSCIPFDREKRGVEVFKHVGLYAYTPDALKKIASFPTCPLEESEFLEQLTPLYHGIPIEVLTTEETIHGVDTLEDLIALESAIN
ncbi:MAG: 3-deoxy-manno-octulosonate cytidylyltransferase [Chlamydiia bacterium]